jgi:hypothetical protein
MNLASSYFDKELPPHYRRRRYVSQLSSRWMSVVPYRHRHQETYSISATPKLSSECRTEKAA